MTVQWGTLSGRRKKTVVGKWSFTYDLSFQRKFTRHTHTPPHLHLFTRNRNHFYGRWQTVPERLRSVTRNVGKQTTTNYGRYRDPSESSLVPRHSCILNKSQWVSPKPDSVYVDLGHRIGPRLLHRYVCQSYRDWSPLRGRRNSLWRDPTSMDSTQNFLPVLRVCTPSLLFKSVLFPSFLPEPVYVPLLYHTSKNPWPLILIFGLVDQGYMTNEHSQWLIFRPWYLT